MSERPVSLPFDVIEQVGPLARAVAEANGRVEDGWYFHLEVRYPGDGCMGYIDGDLPDYFRFAWNPDEENKR